MSAKMSLPFAYADTKLVMRSVAFTFASESRANKEVCFLFAHVSEEKHVHEFSDRSEFKFEALISLNKDNKRR